MQSRNEINPFMGNLNFQLNYKNDLLFPQCEQAVVNDNLTSVLFRNNTYRLGDVAYFHCEDIKFKARSKHVKEVIVDRSMVCGQITKLKIYYFYLRMKKLSNKNSLINHNDSCMSYFNLEITSLSFPYWPNIDYQMCLTL